MRENFVAIYFERATAKLPYVAVMRLTDRQCFSLYGWISTQVITMGRLEFDPLVGCLLKDSEQPNVRESAQPSGRSDTMKTSLTSCA